MNVNKFNTLFFLKYFFYNQWKIIYLFNILNPIAKKKTFWFLAEWILVVKFRFSEQFVSEQFIRNWTWLFPTICLNSSWELASNNLSSIIYLKKYSLRSKFKNHLKNMFVPKYKIFYRLFLDHLLPFFQLYPSFILLTVLEYENQHSMRLYKKGNLIIFCLHKSAI